MTHDVHAVATAFQAAGHNLQAARAETLKRCAEAARVTMLAAPGAPSHVRNMKNAATTVKATVAGDTARVKWIGPAHIVNNPTAAHFITPKGTGSVKRMKSGRQTRRAAKLAFGMGGGGKRAGDHALKMPDGNFAAWSHTRGTKGKQFFQKGRDASAVIVPLVYHREFKSSLAKSF